MIRLLPALLVGLGLILPLLRADPAAKPLRHPQRPLLWKVTGKELKKPSWLFGMIHLGQGALGTLHPQASAALEASDVVYTEVAMDSASLLGQTRHFLRDDGTTLSRSIGDELHNQFIAELNRVSPSLGVAVFEAFKTWAVAVTIPLLKVQLQGSQPLDAIIWQKAVAADKSIKALETAADQFGIFDALTEQEQIILLAESLRQMREARAAGEDPVQLLVDAYLTGDPKKVEREVERQFQEMARGEHQALGKKLLKQLLEDRDISMSKTMAGHLEAHPGQSHFFAVGAAHYVGKDHIGEQLRARGYTVELVTP
jgi:uncharacterized protein YbaP (TraB family)